MAMGHGSLQEQAINPHLVFYGLLMGVNGMMHPVVDLLVVVDTMEIA